MTHQQRVLLATAALSLLRPSSAGDASCVPVTTNTFCTGVTWNVTIGLVPPADIDAQAKADYEQALSKLSRPGQPPASRACFAAWKGLNCARKFPRCLPGLHMDAVTTCQTLCEEFAHACNASELMLVSKGACASAQFDIPPCTDYIDPLPSGLSTMYSADWPPGGSPGELLSSFMAVPILLALFVTSLHLCCCAVQSLCGGGTAEERKSDGATLAHDALRDLLAKKGEEQQLNPGKARLDPQEETDL
tara:strand:+ start:372 stop:1115 length:744 start_codon:yes stop_codon:yes gene_type:complete